MEQILGWRPVEGCPVTDIQGKDRTAVPERMQAAGDVLSAPATGAVDELARRLPAERARLTAGGVTA
jgi:hypothetical protein